ncbi:YegS/Rv2252/BmrU family lipid kinase [Colwellia piezophila]|uniref:YegS/Rv2252/BmrU family lipid kinase n=1 Tax=Colwellia piezophila TaxID=211668 RepID=UPI00036BB48D|nr:YegS/Rv2252/BmrU family lipid kinase [Colwellia piezophila]
MAESTILVLHRKSVNEPYVKEAIKKVKKEGYDLRVLVPFNKSEKPRIVQEAINSGATRIIAGGGDGTINAVVNAIVGDGKIKPDLTLGILPLGTANDFARGCKLPVDDLAECLRIGCEREGREIDIGVLNGRNFINVASLGFGAEITATTPIKLKKALGGAAYTLVGMVKVMDLSSYECRVKIPGEAAIEGSMYFAAVANNHYAGGGFDIAPLSKIDDGLLDLVAIRADRGLQLKHIIKELEDPMNPDNIHIVYRQLAEFTIESDIKLHCNLDGEPMHKKILRFSIRPRHLKVAF